MPGKRISELTALSGAGSANNDDLVIFDSGAGETKRISRSQLAEGMIEDLPFLYFHGVLTSDPTQRLNGDSLEIGDGYLRSSDMIFRYYTSSGWQNYEQIAIAAAQAWAEGTLPGGAGTKSSREWSLVSEAEADRSATEANRAQGFANSVAPTFGRITYFVSNGGDDTADGITPATAFQTLFKASGVAQPGDIVRVERGGLWREEAQFAAGVVIEPYGSGPRPVFSARDLTGTLTIHSTGPAYTFAVTLPLSGAGSSASYFGVFEDGLRLTEYVVGVGGIADAAAAIAAVEADPGSFYADRDRTLGWGEGASTTYYVHASDGGDPNSNGKTYEVYKRNFPIVGSNSLLRGVELHMGQHHNGIGATAGSLQLDDVRILFPGRHGMLPEVPVVNGTTVIGMNPKYAAGAYHSNPVGAGTEPDGVIRNSHAIDDNVDAGHIAFYTHGSAGVVWRTHMTVVDCSASGFNIGAKYDEVQNVDLINFRAENVNQLFSILDGRSWRVFGGSYRGGDGGSSANASARGLALPPNSSLLLRDFYYDVRSQNVFFTPTATGAYGDVDAENCTFVLRSRVISGSTATFYVSQAGSAAARLRLKSTTCVMAGGNPVSIFLSANSFTALDIDQVLIVGAKDVQGAPQEDPICSIGGSSVGLSTLTGVGRFISIAPEKCLLEDGDQGIRFREGTYRPNDYIFSGVAMAPDSDTPRQTTLVGDIIARHVNNLSVQAVYTPSSHLNAICFVNDAVATNRQFVTVGDDGLIVISDDGGDDWATATSGTSENLLAVAAAATGGLVVAVGANGTVIRSTDYGATWAPATTPGTTRTMRAVAINGTTVIAAGDEGRVIRSTDSGDTFTEATVGSATHRALHRSNLASLFLLGSDVGALRTSTDGSSWTSQTTGTRNRVVAFAEGEGGIVAALRQTTTHTDTFLTSVNGTTWAVDTATKLPFEVRALCGPGDAGGSTYLDFAFSAVGEAQTIARRRGGQWAAQRILDTASRATPISVERALAET